MSFLIMSRSISLQTNAMFHIPAFLNPLENGIRNRFTCYFLKDFSRKSIDFLVSNISPS